MCVCVCVCVRPSVRPSVRACMRVCVRACARAHVLWFLFLRSCGRSDRKNNTYSFALFSLPSLTLTGGIEKDEGSARVASVPTKSLAKVQQVFALTESLHNGLERITEPKI